MKIAQESTSALLDNNEVELNQRNVIAISTVNLAPQEILTADPLPSLPII